MAKYQHLFWDLDHTLWDFDGNSLIALEQTFIKHNISSTYNISFMEFDKAYHFQNNKYWALFRKGIISREVLRWKRFYSTLLEFKINNEELSHAMGNTYLDILPHQKALMPHAIEILEYCAQKNYVQHLITNGFEETQKQKLNNTKIAHFFSMLITSEMAMSIKPHADIFKYALQQSNAEMHSSIMIGDALVVDVKGAMDFGMDAIWFKTEPDRPVDIDVKPTYTITNLLQLKDIL